MKPYEDALAPFSAPPRHGRGWRVLIDELVVATRIGLHAHEYAAPQPVVIDASLIYRGEPSEEGAHAMIDYERYCERVSAFLADKPHTRLLETLAVELAELSFREWPALDALTLALHKPKIREGTRRIGVELDWTRADYDALRARVSVQAVVAAR
ncbi:MAG: dihydroneopterin aldolase [Paraburkholderia sp.]|uniref:dihydroneopterin aldolase n=1 Tax=Burkholderiaceae TaxID=119060 RepID=UPI001485B9A6|nr:dihydroneopterin aldolase [Burkholderia sp. 4M9327F10]